MGPLFLLYCIGTFIMYIGIQKFAKLLQVRALPLSPLIFIVAVTALGTVVSWFFPYTGAGREESTFFFGLLSFSGACSAVAAFVGWRIRQAIGASYKRPMTWLTAGLSMIAFYYFQVAFVQSIGMSVGFLKWYDAYHLVLWPSIFGSISLLRAGQLFKWTGLQYGTLSKDANTIDIVLYVAGLSSDQRGIDQALDTVRQLTASMQSTSELRPEDEPQLIRTYLKIEDYLVTQEPLRRFIRQDIRARLPYEFQQKLVAYEASF